MIDATKILCPVDFSAPSVRALRHAIAVAADRRIPLHVMTVAEDPFRYLDVGPTLADAGGLGEKLARFIQAQLPPAGQWTIDLETSIAFGVAFQEIVRAALDRGAGRARCPVLVLSTPKQVETAFEISRACMAVG